MTEIDDTEVGVFHPKSGAVSTRKWRGLPDSFLRQRRVDERMRIIIANDCE